MRLLGRDRESARLRALLLGDGRAVGISGRAGVGKSALLADLDEHRPEGGDVWHVDLDGSAATGLLAAVARELGIGAVGPGSGDADSASRIARVIGGSPVVLAVDHADECVLREDEASALLNSCPRLRIVVARSTPLGGLFHDIPLLPLETPAADALPEEILTFPSVQLFIDRALRSDARFRQTPETLDAVAEICRLVGGLPLAIELAAARVRIIPPERLAHELAESADSLDLLSQRADPRRPGVREALAATVRALEDDERRLLERLSCFVGRFPFAAAVAVDGRPAGEVADGLERLADLRLLLTAVSPFGEPEFSLLPIVRRFVTEKGVSADAASARRAYLERTLAAAERACARAQRPSALAHARALRRDLVSEAQTRFDDDPRDAAAWITACAAVLAGDAESSLVGELLESLIAAGHVDALPPGVRARVWLWSAYGLAFSPDGTALADVIRERLRRGAGLADEGADGLLALQCRLIAIVVAVTTGDLLPAARAAGEGRAMALEQAQPTWAARFGVWLAAATNSIGQADEAVALALEALRHGQLVMDSYAIAGATIILRTVPPGTLTTDAAIPSLEDALGLVRREHDVLFEWFVLGALTHVELAAGRPREAAHWCAERLAGGAQRGWTYLVAISLVHTVLIAATLGDFSFAARILGAIDADRERVLRSMAPASTAELDRARSLIASRLGDAHSAAITATGAVLSLADASAGAVPWLRAHAVAPRPPAPPEPAPDGSLTAREREVLAVLAEGHPNKMIAQRLGVSTKTVMHHSVAIYRKLGVSGRAEATAYAYRHGLMELDSA